MRRSYLALLLLFTSHGPVAALEGEIYRGLAHAPEDGRLIYLEDHFVRQAQGQVLERRVLYRCPDGAAFARKEVHYADPAWMPSFALEDVRFGYQEGFRRGRISGEVWYRRSDAHPQERDVLALGESLVVDAGFDEFVRAAWAQLVEGRQVPLRFLVPSRRSAWAFHVRKAGRSERFGETAVDLRLEVAGVLGWFADPIEVSYRERDRRLMRFYGVSNLRRGPQQNFVVEILFPPELERPLTKAEWDRAVEEPLTACALQP